MHLISFRRLVTVLQTCYSFNLSMRDDSILDYDLLAYCLLETVKLFKAGNWLYECVTHFIFKDFQCGRSSRPAAFVKDLFHTWHPRCRSLFLNLSSILSYGLFKDFQPVDILKSKVVASLLFFYFPTLALDINMAPIICRSEEKLKMCWLF